MPNRFGAVFSAAAVAAALACLVVACSSSKAPVSGPHLAGLDQIESRLGHKISRPGPALGAVLIRSGFLDPSGSTFKGLTAAASYTWHDRVVLIRQGTPADGWTLHGSINRGDVTFQTRTDGSEVAFLPQVGGSSASASIVPAGWLVNVDIAASTPKGPVPLDDLKAFVNGLEP